MRLEVTGFEEVNEPSKIKEGADYILLLYFGSKKVIEVGALGQLTFKKGTYAYCGSAKSGLWGRVKRHLSDPKKKRWHIDYITESSSERKVLWKPHSVHGECEAAKNLSQDFDGLDKFGCSDCKCRTHLFCIGEDRISGK